MKISLIMAFCLGLTFAQGSDHALSFDGTNDYIGVGTTSDFTFPQNTGVFTFEAWAKFEVLNGKGQSIISSGLATNERGFSFLLETRGANDNLRLFLGRGVGGSATIDSKAPSGLITDNEWHHVAAVGNGTNITFYIDGVAYAGTGSIGTLSSGNASRATRLGDFYSSAYGIGSTGHFEGNLDEIRIWDRALTADEIRHKMTERLTGTESGLVAYYRMDQDLCAPSDVCDASGNGNHGTRN